VHVFLSEYKKFILKRSYMKQALIGGLMVIFTICAFDEKNDLSEAKQRFESKIQWGHAQEIIITRATVSGLPELTCYRVTETM
jgi:hypothetical protein